MITQLGFVVSVDPSTPIIGSYTVSFSEGHRVEVDQSIVSHSTPPRPAIGKSGFRTGDVIVIDGYAYRIRGF